MTDWIDITRTLSETTLVWPGDLLFSRRLVSPDRPGEPVTSEIHCSAHAGTHVDAPLHVVPGGRDVAALPLAALCGPATVVDLTDTRDVTAEDLAGAAIPRGDRVLLRTVNRHVWRTRTFEPDYVSLTVEAARWLVAHAVPLVGVDALSVDRFDADPLIVHRTLLNADVVVLEGADLDRVGAGRYELIVLPLKIAGGDGSPARAVLRPLG